MGRKVFISFLGTNNYLQTRYEIQGVCSAPVRFVQEALTDALCQDWTEEDRILIFYTKKSYACNWKNGGQSRVLEDKEVEYYGLESRLSAKSYGALVHGEEIPEGFTEDEVWQIFNTVYEQLKDGDKIYLDVTHAFRSIPLFSTILFNFAQFMRGTVLKQVCYGAFEKLGPAYEVKASIPIMERVAPVLDLTNIIQLQNLTQVASAFVQYGKVGDIGNAFEMGGNKRVNMLIQEFRAEINKLDGYIATNKIEEIEKGQFVANIRQSMQNLEKKTSLTTPQRDILQKLSDNIAPFEVNGGFRNIVAALEWAFRYDMIQQAYTLAQESIISATLQKVTDRLAETFNKEKAKRNFVASILGISPEDKAAHNYQKELMVNIALTEELFELPLIHELRQPYATIAKNRNELCHGKRSALTINKYKEQLQEKFKTCRELLEF